MILYKYLTPDRIDVLQNCMVRYTQPEAFNDPFEVKPYITKIDAEEDEACSQFEECLLKLLRETCEKQPKHVQDKLSYDALLKLAQEVIGPDFKKAFYDFMEMLTPMIRSTWTEKFTNTFGIFSLTEKPDNLLMWAHYAASHEGFVIGFDSDQPCFHEKNRPGDELHHIRKVEYRENRPALAFSEISGTEILMIKSTQWSYEQEWRIIRHLQEANKIIQAHPYPIHLFQFPSAAVSEIILGCRMNEEKREDITKILMSDSFRHVQIHQAKSDEIEFKLQISSVMR